MDYNSKIFHHLYISSLLISFSNFLPNFNLDVLCLVGSDVGAGSDAGAGLSAVAGSGACSGVGISSRFFTGNILLLKLLRIFSLAPGINPRLFKKYLFLTCFIPLSTFFNSFTNLLCSLSASPNANFF